MVERGHLCPHEREARESERAARAGGQGCPRSIIRHLFTDEILCVRSPTVREGTLQLACPKMNLALPNGRASDSLESKS